MLNMKKTYFKSHSVLLIVTDAYCIAHHVTGQKLICTANQFHLPRTKTFSRHFEISKHRGVLFLH